VKEHHLLYQVYVEVSSLEETEAFQRKMKRKPDGQYRLLPYHLRSKLINLPGSIRTRATTSKHISSLHYLSAY